MKLTETNHDRDSAGMTYVYPVVSRRAHGVSVGVNLHPNNACNWRCVYCQVPNLTRGAAPEIDLAKLASELRTLLARVQDPAWMQQHVPEGSRRLNDVALSGNGEPTTCDQFEEVLTIDPVDRDRALAYPCVKGYVTKPIDLESAAGLRKLLGG